jgi:hypothetical protein
MTLSERRLLTVQQVHGSALKRGGLYRLFNAEAVEFASWLT